MIYELVIESCREAIAVYGGAGCVCTEAAEPEVAVEEICRKLGISDATFYNWKKKFSGLGPSALRRLKQLEAESTKLKRLVADLSLDKTMLQDVVRRKT
jgi:putative transposase